MRDVVVDRLARYAARHLTPMSRVVKRLLNALPWDDDSVDYVVLKLPKTVANNLERLGGWLREAVDEVKAYYCEN